MPEIRLTEDLYSLVSFQENASRLVAQARETHRPIVLTVDGKAEAVVMGAADYQNMLDLPAAADGDVETALFEGEEDIRLGKTVPLEQGMEQIKAACGLQS